MAQKKTTKRRKTTAARAVQPKKTTLATRIEEAMAMALKICQAEGITDPGEIRLRINAAREEVVRS